MLAFVFFPPIIAERYSYTNIYLNSDFGGKDILILRENTILYLTSIKVNVLSAIISHFDDREHS